MSETFLGEDWLYNTLKADAAGVGDRVWANLAPEDATPPFITFQLQGGVDSPKFSSVRTTEATYLVKAVDRGWDKSAAADVAAAIDDLLEKASGTVTGGAIIGCIREAPFELTENADGVVWQHIGGLYRVFIEQT